VLCSSCVLYLYFFFRGLSLLFSWQQGFKPEMCLWLSSESKQLCQALSHGLKNTLKAIFKEI
jgi:hypothetical protein